MPGHWWNLSQKRRQNAWAPSRVLDAATAERVWSHEPRKSRCDFAIHLAPERHHEIGDMVEPLPAPLVEFRLLSVARRQRIDFAVLAGEAQREPFLALA